MTDMTCASAATLAAALSIPVRSGREYRIACPLHNGDSSDSLTISEPKVPGQSVHVHCYGGCDRDKVRHKLEEITGLHLCRCDECFAKKRTPQSQWKRELRPVPLGPGHRGNGHTASQSAPGGRHQDAAKIWANGRDPNDYDWTGRWLDRWGLSPPPPSIRALSRDRLRFLGVSIGDSAAGVLCGAMTAAPGEDVHKVCLCAVCSDGNKAREAFRWASGNTGDKMTLGQVPDGFLWLVPDRCRENALVVVEGLKDGLAILAGLWQELAALDVRIDSPPIVCAPITTVGVFADRVSDTMLRGKSVSLIIDADEGGIAAGQRAREKLIKRCGRVTTVTPASGQDPADWWLSIRPQVIREKKQCDLCGRQSAEIISDLLWPGSVSCIDRTRCEAAQWEAHDR